MSDTPKYSQAQLDAQRREQLEQERQRRAAEEERQRREAEERERKRQLEELRNRLAGEAEALAKRVRSTGNELYAHDADRLQTRCAQLISGLQAAGTEKELRRQGAEIERIVSDLNDAASQKRRDDEEKRRLAELDRLRFRLSEVHRRLSEVPPHEASKFDPSGATATNQAIVKATSAIAAGNPESARTPLIRAEEALRTHLNTVAHAREEWQRKKAAAEQALSELIAFIGGLKVDPVLVRWHGHSVAQLEATINEAHDAIANERFDRPSAILSTARAKAKEMVEQANQAQIKADQRDYIARSIAQTLQAMNFTVSPAWQEHPGHPASALVLEAATGSNKSVYVSVPLEGRIMYTVNGYPMKTETSVGGGKAAVCDEAEGVLNEMQQNVEAMFGVKMDEVWWEGKDPRRRLQGADELPTSTSNQARGRR